MNSPNVRNILLLIIAVVIAVVVLSFLSTLLSAVVPIAIAAVVFFILGRLSVNFNLLNFVRSSLSAQSKPAEEKPAETKVAPAVTKPAETPGTKPKAAAASTEAIPEKPINPDLLLDTSFEIKTAEQIEAEARLREQEATKRAAGNDVNAALEERRKRLLGNKGNGG